ncbi:hypothetical protein EVG20_g6866 [Dentipellis fragilis]|uniref:Uncharacterized protein n=1 Tax=Dentipellis fragilis TaxID=205917 RepID=A0A4Y9YHG2_9AGAM|nr:hypothetical protein EVG20_g6866 [Dentipellis fragilis]
MSSLLSSALRSALTHQNPIDYGNNHWLYVKRYFQDIGKFKLSQLDDQMHDLIKNAVLKVEKDDPDMHAITVMGQLHDSTSCPGQKNVTVRGFTEDGEHWGTFRVDTMGKYHLSLKAQKSIAASRLRRGLTAAPGPSDET